jgi:hypothetical protein
MCYHVTPEIAPRVHVCVSVHTAGSSGEQCQKWAWLVTPTRGAQHFIISHVLSRQVKSQHIPVWESLQCSKKHTWVSTREKARAGLCWRKKSGHNPSPWC